MNITDRGKKWEIFNSLWILWSFTLVLACAGFFWIGGRAGKRKWIVSGIIYLIVNFGLIYAVDPLESVNSIYSSIVTVVICFGWFAAIVHSFISRKEYLLRREAVIDLKDATRNAYRYEIRKDYFGNNEKSVGVFLSTANQVAASASQSPPTVTPTKKIDLNNCSDQELANLPGVGVALAKRAIEMRVQTGGFTSVEDFNQQLRLMPHFAEQIDNLAFVDSIQPKIPPSESSGRVIDI